MAENGRESAITKYHAKKKKGQETLPWEVDQQPHQQRNGMWLGAEVRPCLRPIFFARKSYLEAQPMGWMAICPHHGFPVGRQAMKETIPPVQQEAHPFRLDLLTGRLPMAIHDTGCPGIHPRLGPRRCCGFP